jgi:hypothetical protein
LSEDSTRLLTHDRALPALLLLNQNLYKWRTTSRVWYLKYHRHGVFIRVQGGVTNLIKLVTCQVLASRPSHGAGLPPSPASTKFQHWIPYHCLQESVAVKPTHERLQSGAGRPRPAPTGRQNSIVCKKWVLQQPFYRRVKGWLASQGW